MLRLECPNPNQCKYLPGETVECTKLVGKFTAKVEVTCLDHTCFFPLSKETVFHNHSFFVLLSLVSIKIACENLPQCVKSVL